MSRGFTTPPRPGGRERGPNAKPLRLAAGLLPVRAAVPHLQAADGRRRLSRGAEDLRVSGSVRARGAYRATLTPNRLAPNPAAAASRSAITPTRPIRTGTAPSSDQSSNSAAGGKA